MKLNKSQRHTAYIIMLEEADDFIRYDANWGLCHLIHYNLGINNSGFDDVKRNGSFCFVISHFFPELENKIYPLPPRNKDGWEQRKKILKACIQETY